MGTVLILPAIDETPHYPEFIATKLGVVGINIAPLTMLADLQQIQQVIYLLIEI